MYVHTNTYIWIFIAALVTIIKNVEITWISINWTMDKHTMVYPYDGRLLSNKKAKYWYLQQPRWWTSNTLSERKLDAKGHILCNFVYMKYPIKTNLLKCKVEERFLGNEWDRTFTENEHKNHLRVMEIF